MSADIENQAFAPNEPDMLMAAMGYAKSGLRIFPVALAPHDKAIDKSPPQGYGWTEMSTSKTNDVIEDFANAETDFRQRHGLEPENRMVAWALGLDGFLAIDLDVPKDEWPEWVPDIINDAVISVTKRGVHLIYKFPEGIKPSNSTLKFPGDDTWGEVRGHHGYIVIAGADRPGLDPQAILDAKPFPRPEWLSEAGQSVDAVAWPEVKAFFKRTEEASVMPNKQNGLETILETARTSKNGKGRARHDVLRNVALLAAEEALKGYYPYEPAIKNLKKWFDTVKPESSKREFMGVVCWAVAKALANVEAGTIVEGSAAGTELEATRTGGELNLPPAFWERRQILTVLRDAGHSMLVAPDAVLGSWLARMSAKIPPSCMLPPIIGSQATFDFDSCIVASSSGGKTISNGVAKRLAPKDSSDRILFDQSPGSGEGLIQAFLAQEINEKGKPAGPYSYKFSDVRAIHIVADEGTGLAEQAGRDGATIVQTLCSAWSGAQMGQLNAKQETKRIIPGGKRRVSATINIQTSTAPDLLKWVKVGLPQRLLFMWAHGEFPEQDIEFPELPVYGPFPMSDFATELTVDATIRNEIRAERRAVGSGEKILGEYDGHLKLLTLKVAGILTVTDGRIHVTEDDWSIATEIVEHSCKVRDHIIASSKTAEQQKQHNRAVGRGHADATAEDTKELLAQAKLANRIIKRLTDQPGQTKRELSKMVNSVYRYRFDNAWDDLNTQKRIVETPSSYGATTWNAL